MAEDNEIVSYRGKLIIEMSREELIEALQEISDILREQGERHQEERRFLGIWKIIK